MTSLRWYHTTCYPLWSQGSFNWMLLHAFLCILVYIYTYSNIIYIYTHIHIYSFNLSVGNVLVSSCFLLVSYNKNGFGGYNRTRSFLSPFTLPPIENSSRKPCCNGHGNLGSMSSAWPNRRKAETFRKFFNSGNLTAFLSCHILSH